MEAFLISHLCTARLYHTIVIFTLFRYGRLIEYNPKQEVANMTESLKEYEWIVNFTKTHNVQVLRAELRVCEEMAQLLPLKIRTFSSLR